MTIRYCISMLKGMHGNRCCFKQFCTSMLKGVYGNRCCFKQFCTAPESVTILREIDEEKKKQRKKVIHARGKQKFVDWMRVHLLGGSGGNGSVKFMNARSHKGGPYGGDGGAGGSISIKADNNVTQLKHLKHHYQAGSGGCGMLAWKKGKRGKNIILTVPVGTTIRNHDTGAVIADMVEQDQLVTLVEGGEGGVGNEHFKAPDHVRPRESLPGLQGEELFVEIELKSIADIGLVGFPNAGKSTLLNAITRAKPKIADYPFTTLRPNLGVIHYDNDINVTIADIPGLVEGAHNNKGLGHLFLRHVERCRGLIYVVDVANNDPIEQFNILKNELEMYKADLSLAPQLFVANKCDLLQDNKIIKHIECTIDLPAIAISAKDGYNIENLKAKILVLYECNR